MRTKTFETTESFLRTVAIPEETETYKPFLHGDLIDLTRQGIYQAGFTIQKEGYTMAADGKIANGRYLLNNMNDGEMGIQIAWQNSYNKQVTLKWAIGAHVFICGNGCVSGDMGAFSRKHTGEIQEITPKWISDYIGTASTVFSEMQRFRDNMKVIPVTIETAAEIVGKLFFVEDILRSKQMNIIKNELKHATHDYGAPNTLWELYNFVTFALHTIHPADWMSSHEGVHKYFANLLNFDSSTVTHDHTVPEDDRYTQLDWTKEVEE